ncbi:hypothetical protein ACLFMI_02365 [Pseudonocardia nantongensis]|uniref:hypothetical protein n=1 Tax=Pseudonocardia nantongensis TaxID=1181885 RepID=UPI00397C384A
MSDYGRLALTGVPTIAIFGVTVEQWWIAGIAVLLIAAGIAGLRIGFRRRRGVGSR